MKFRIIHKRRYYYVQYAKPRWTIFGLKYKWKSLYTQTVFEIPYGFKHKEKAIQMTVNALKNQLK